MNQGSDQEYEESFDDYQDTMANLEGKWRFKGYDPESCMELPKCYLDKIQLKQVYKP